MNDTAATPRTEAVEDSRLGTTLDGRYRIVRRLGAGGFGVVYEAEHVLIRRKVAVKMLHAHVASDVDLLARFKREAIAATATGHAHIVEVLDMGRAEDGAAYMVLELLVGCDWAEVLEKDGPQPLGRTVRILLQVLDGLAAAHDKGIVHRDLKAENVFLVERDANPDFVKIVDFGISKMREESDGTPTGGIATTHTGMALGTPVSMAPEQFQGKKDVDHRADLWAVGVMLYRALTGDYPFGGDTYAMLALNVMTEEPAPLGSVRPDLPEGVSVVLARLLDKDRARRFADAREVRAALEPFAGDAAPAPSRGSIERLGLAATQAGTAVDSRPRGAAPTQEPSAPSLALTPDGAPPTRIDAASAQPSRRASSRAAIAIAGTAMLATASAAAWAFATSAPAPTTTDSLPRIEPVGVIDSPTTDASAAALGGHLVLWTTPSCLVSLEGAPLGFTPLSIDLPAGTHLLTLENPDAHILTTYEVTIESGGTRQAVVDLSATESADAGRRPRAGSSAHTTTPVEAPPVRAPVVEVAPPPTVTPPPVVTPAEVAPTDERTTRRGLRRPVE